MKYTEEMNQIVVPETAVELRIDPLRTIHLEEDRCRRTLEKICNMALGSGGQVILLCGPSSSGKPAASHRIAAELERRNKKARIISLDHFCVPPRRVPEIGARSDTVGEPDLDEMEQVLEELWKTGSAAVPIFDFRTQTRLKQSQRIDWDERTYLILTGIYALHPGISALLRDRCALRIYVSVHSDFVDTEGNVILGARELRLMRRMVRDYYHCNFSAMQTLSVWEKVLRREDVLMRPHRLLADVHIDTTHSYEPFLYHDAIARLLGEAGDCGIFQPLAERILAAQGHFFQIPRELIPGTSLIQAFLH